MPDRHDADEYPRSRGKALVVVTLVLAIAALGLSSWTLFRLSQADELSGKTYTESQRTEAKTTICSAADLVRRGVSLNTNLQPAGGPEDVTGALAVAANSRVALYDGGQYLMRGAQRPRQQVDQPRHGRTDQPDHALRRAAQAPRRDHPEDAHPDTARAGARRPGAAHGLPQHSAARGLLADRAGAQRLGLLDAVRSWSETHIDQSKCAREAYDERAGRDLEPVG